LENQYQSIGSRYAEARRDPVTLFLEMPSVKGALGDVRGKNAIDFACGTGYYSRLLKTLGAKTVVGVDLSPAMIEVAQLEENTNPLGIEYTVGDAAEPQIFGSFDVATAVFLFNYADDRRTLDRMFSNVAANLINGGKLVSVVPNPDFVNGLQDTLKYDFYLEEIERRPSNLHVRMHFLAPEKFSIEFTQWNRLSYETAMRRCGFAEISWIPFSVSAEGITNYGTDYWAALIKNPKSIILCARKSVSPTFVMQ
jgi:toxoflavin synthase